MKKTYLLILCACLVGVWIIIKMWDWLIGPEAHYPIPRHIQYSFTIQNTTNRLVKQAEFWSYAPVKQTSTQQCVNVEASHPFELISDDLGNQILHFTFQNLPPFTTKIITIKAKLLLSDTPNRLPVKDLQPYLQAEKYCESDDPEIARLARRLKGPKKVRSAENIFRWVADNIQYAGYLRNARGAIHALKNKKGDCTEFMYLFAALSRANEIPARCIGGYVRRENAILKPNGYHNWVEFRDNGIWRIADPQRKIFMQDQSRYIAMHVISESLKNPMGNSHRFRWAGKGLKVKMNG